MSRLLLAIRLGVAAGMVLGFASGMPYIMGQDYLGGHLYRTAAAYLVTCTNKHLPVTLGISLFMLFLLWISFLRNKRAMHWLHNLRVVSSWRSHRTFTGALSLCFNTVVWTLFILAAGLYLSAGYLQASTTYQARKRPNIVFIMVDTLRPDHMGCYGYSRNTTPNIDELARHSIRAERAIAQASWTTWSVASFMTSHYPQSMNLGEVRNPGAVNPKYTTLPEILKDAGYTTGAAIANPNAGTGINLQQGYDSFDESVGFDTVTSQDVSRSALRWLCGTENRPFFLFALFMDCHAPYHEHPEYNFDPGYKGRFAEDARPGPDDGITYSGREVQHIEALYDSEIAYTDKYVGRLLNGLKTMGLYDDSLIILLADHGEEFKDHGGFGHARTLYDELIKVPLLVKLPHQKEGRVLKGTFRLIDVLPSILGAAGIDSSSRPIQGEDAHIATTFSRASRPIYSAVQLKGRQLRSVEKSPYKYMTVLNSKESELYDVLRDPREKTNMASRKPDMVKRLRSELLEHERTVMKNAGLGEPRIGNTFTEQERQRLHSLGYAQ